jgi:hypothetical protein
MATPPRIGLPSLKSQRTPTAPAEKATQTSDILTQRGVERLAELHRRAVLGIEDRRKQHGSEWLSRTEFKNERGYAVRCYVEVTKGGPVGATLTFDGDAIPADMPGAVSRSVALDANDNVDIKASDAAIMFNIVIVAPEIQ